MATGIKRLAALAAAMLFGGAAASGAPIPSDPRATALIDQRGDTFRILDLAGKPTLVTFVATRCTDTCPIANAVFYKLAQRLRADRVDARLLTITLDPAYDTPYVFAAAARRFDADPNQWRFASGSVPDVKRLMAALGVTTTPDARGIPEAHGTFVFLLDRHARLARTFLLSSSLVDDGERALRDVR